MTDLADEVRASFQSHPDDDDPSPVQIVQQSEKELAPAFQAMREFYSERLVVATRRAYRQFAGAQLTDQGDELLALTTPRMLPALIAIALESFADGVMIGHQQHVLVQMAFHWKTPEHVYHEEEFRTAATKMAAGFADDDGVLEFMNEYISGAVGHMAHTCGFAHATVDSRKVWDIWMLSGTATITASYLAGYRMGTGWRERDVLDGIALASEEGSDGS